MPQRKHVLLSTLTLATILLISAGTLGFPIAHLAENTADPSPNAVQCTHQTDTATITDTPPQATITTLSGMPNKSFNPFFQDMNYTLAYKVSISLPNNTTTGEISLPENTTFASTNQSLTNTTNSTATINNQHIEFIIHSNKLDDITGDKYKTYEPYAIYSNIPDILVQYNENCVNLGSHEANLTMTASNGTLHHTNETYYKILNNKTFQTETITINNTTTTIVKPNHRPLKDSNMSSIKTRTKQVLTEYSQFPKKISLYIVPDSVTGASGVTLPQGPQSEFVWVTTDVDPNESMFVLTHELMHTRQQYTLGPKMSWFTEASAEYLAANGTHTPSITQIVKPYYANDYADKNPTPVLTDSSSWSEATPYNKGALVLYHLNKQLEPHEYSVNDLLVWMNTHTGTVTYDEFITKLETESNASVADWADTHIDGTALPPVEPTTED